MRNIRSIMFDVRMKTWPIRVWLMNLSWLPIWYVRKDVPRFWLTWTPAATIRRLSKQVEHLEKKNAEYLKSWGRTEDALRDERMARVADTMPQELKDTVAKAFGVRFRGSEEN